MTVSAANLAQATKDAEELCAVVLRDARERGLNVQHFSLTYTVEGKRMQVMCEGGVVRVLTVPETPPYGGDHRG